MFRVQDFCGLGLVGFFGIWRFRGLGFPKGPCTHIVYTLAPKYLYRDYIKDNVYTI